MRLKRESPTPLYMQLKNTLIKEITSGRYKPHQQLPSERELGERFNVSRMTVRQALADLIQQGAVYARVGKGTFVSEPKINQELIALTGFSQDVAQRGSVPSSRVLEAHLMPATIQLATVLQTDTNDNLIMLSRLRLSDGMPLSIETAYLPAQLFPGLLQHDFAVESLYRVIQQDYGICMTRAHEALEADLAKTDELALLELTHPAAVLRIERLTFGESEGRELPAAELSGSDRPRKEKPVEYVLSTYRGDRYKFRTILTSQV